MCDGPVNANFNKSNAELSVGESLSRYIISLVLRLLSDTIMKLEIDVSEFKHKTMLEVLLQKLPDGRHKS
jgi:hypothetical protein